MHIWVDADACPKAVKELLFRAAERREVPCTLVANKPLWTPPGPHVTSLVVGAGFDVADDEIVERCNPGDLVITADIPLAALVVEKGATGLNPRGELYTEDNIGERLAMRDFMAQMRETGMETGGPAGFGSKDRQNFACALDLFLTRSLGQIKPAEKNN